MKIAIVSDTHGSVESFLNGISEVEIDRIFHLGDLARDALEIERRTNIPVTAVLGNNESFQDQKALLKEMPWVTHLVIEEKEILLTHGHKYGVYYGIDELEILGKEHGVDLLFYGHTHRFYLEEKEGIIFCNPGSASFPRDGKKSFVLWDTGKNNLKRIFL